MIRQIAEFIDAKLALTGWIEKFFPLVKQVYDGDKATPGYYLGNSQYQHISNFDNWNGMAYLRQTSSPTSEENTDLQSLKGCANALNIRYPLRLVFCIKRTQVKLDDAFAEDRLISSLVKEITAKNGTLKTSIKAISVSLIPESWTTEAIDVVAEEYPGRTSISINTEYIYGAINFNASVLIDKECIVDQCEDSCYAY